MCWQPQRWHGAHTWRQGRATVLASVGDSGARAIFGPARSGTTLTFRRALGGHVARPRLHQFAPLLNRRRPAIGRLHLAFTACASAACDLAREVGLVAAPVSEGAAEAVRVTSVLPMRRMTLAMAMFDSPPSFVGPMNTWPFSSSRGPEARISSARRAARRVPSRPSSLRPGPSTSWRRRRFPPTSRRWFRRCGRRSGW